MVRTGRVLASVGLAGVVAACGANVPMADPTPTGSTSAACVALIADLPATVLDGKRRPAEPGVYSAAWGEPPISLRCGVDKPPTLTASSECYEVNGVGWFAEPAGTGMLFTTIGRQFYVEVGVPTRYAPEANALTDLSGPVGTYDPVVTPCA